ncbi:FAD:protein FMN transferase [Allostella sp. ATCC 35155]|nr:FAD:protein FMN transferase [Stella sp. ATCC 35155]
MPALADLRPRPAGERLLALAGRSMGTTWQVRFCAGPGMTPRVVRDCVEGVLDRIVAEASGWEASSALCRFGSAPGGTRQTLPPGLFGVLQFAVELAAATGGACDPTLGAVTDLWGFGPSGPRDRPPPDAAVAAARAATGWRRLALDAADRSAFQPGGLRLDLSGIAKGWAVDQVGAALCELGVESHLVEIGGELRGRGIKPDGQPWWVALEPIPGDCGPETLIALHELAVATSGSYRRFFEADGRRFAHTIDPRTARPLAAPPLAVTVLHRDCMAADALATALTVLGVEAGLEHARRHGIAARFALPDGDATSPAFDAMLD